MLAVISVIGLGITVGGIVGAIVTDDPLYWVGWAIAFAVACLAGAFAGVRSFRRGIETATSAEPVPTGELALARVESIRRTGMSVNDQPQCELLLTVAPRHRAPYTTLHRQIVDVVELAQLQPGSIIVVRRPDNASANVLLQLAPPEEWAGLRDAERLRVGSDRTIPLASEAPLWASEPQPLFTIVKGPARPWRRVLFVGLFLASAALALVPAYDDIERTARAWASGDPASAGVVLGDRHEQIVDALVAETGGTQFVDVAFYDSYAIATAPSQPGALTMDSYQFRYDRTERQGPELIQPQDPAAALFDVEEIDFSRIPEYIATARERSGIADPDSVIVIVERTTVADEAGARPVQVLVLLDATYEDANITFDAVSGEVLR